MKKILFVAPIDANGRYLGGISSFALSILNDTFFKNNGILFLPISSSQIKRDAYSGGKVRFNNFLNYFKLKKEIKKAIKKDKVDKIYINTSRNLALLKDLCLVDGKKYRRFEIIFHIHFADFNEVFHKNGFIRRITINKMKKIASKIIVLSSALKEEMINHGFPERKIFVLRNYFSPQLRSVENKNRETTTINYLFVGSITERKGIYTLLDIFNGMDDSYQLFVCGTPNEINGELAVDKFKSKKNIHFMGFVSDKQKDQVFSQCDVFVLPTLAEGLPISILEAYFYGLGVITTKVGAIPEIVGESNGILINKNDKSALEQAIVFYHDNNECLKEHKSNNKVESKKYTFDSFKKNLLKILNE